MDAIGTAHALSRGAARASRIRRRFADELERVSAQIANVVDSLASVGKSAAFTSRLRDLEQRKIELAARVAQRPAKLQIVPDVEKPFRDVIDKLEHLPRRVKADPTTLHRVRRELQDYLGPVKVRRTTGARACAGSPDPGSAGPLQHAICWRMA